MQRCNYTRFKSVCRSPKMQVRSAENCVMLIKTDFSVLIMHSPWCCTALPACQNNQHQLMPAGVWCLWCCICHCSSVIPWFNSLHPRREKPANRWTSFISDQPCLCFSCMRRTPKKILSPRHTRSCVSREYPVTKVELCKGRGWEISCKAVTICQWYLCTKVGCSFEEPYCAWVCTD